MESIIPKSMTQAGGGMESIVPKSISLYYILIYIELGEGGSSRCNTPDVSLIWTSVNVFQAKRTQVSAESVLDDPDSPEIMLCIVSRD